jgi:hypothetical protein
LESRNIGWGKSWLPGASFIVSVRFDAAQSIKVPILVSAPALTEPNAIKHDQIIYFWEPNHIYLVGLSRTIFSLCESRKNVKQAMVNIERDWPWLGNLLGGGRYMYRPNKLIYAAVALGLATSGLFPSTAMAVLTTLPVIPQPPTGPFSKLPWAPPFTEKTPDYPKDVPHGQPREQPREQQKEEPREAPREQPKDQPTDLPKERDQPNIPGELPKEGPKEQPRELPRDLPKEQPQPAPQPQPSHPLPRPEPAPQSHDRPWIDAKPDYPL